MMVENTVHRKICSHFYGEQKLFKLPAHLNSFLVNGDDVKYYWPFLKVNVQYRSFFHR